jgi:hypothetical protein
MLREADTMFARGKYKESGWYYRQYLKEYCCPVKEKTEINSKIEKADSLKMVKDSLDKVKLCSIVLQHADNFYKHKEFEQALKYIGFYQKNHACPIQDTNKIFFKIIALDSLIMLEKN